MHSKNQQRPFEVTDTVLNYRKKMSLGKVARKLKRVGKTAYQFRITSTFEYIELNCHGTWWVIAISLVSDARGASFFCGFTCAWEEVLARSQIRAEGFSPS